MNPENQTNESKPLLPLDLPERVISWRNESGVIRSHVFRRITADLWNGYFARLVVESDRKGRTIDMNSAALWLYGEAVLRAAGYAVRGGGELTELPCWQDRIPMGHRLQATGFLSDAGNSEEETIEIEPECEIVRLDAMWNSSEPGVMLKFTGLVHRFTPPSSAHQQRYSRELSRSLIVGGSRDGKTIHPIRQKSLVTLYDELIQSVDGYSLNGQALAGKDDAIREMDLLHKVTATGQLFSVFGEQEAEAPTE